MTKRTLPPILLSLVLSVASLVAAPKRLTPDNLTTISFGDIDTLTLFNGDDGFFVDVPSDAARVVINLTSFAYGIRDRSFRAFRYRAGEGA